MANPFGFAVNVPQGAYAPPRAPQDIPSAPFGFAPPPSKMERTWDIVKPYVTGPVDAFWNLYNSPFALGFDPTEQDAGNGLAAAGGAMMAGSVVPKEANALNMGFRVFHGSPHNFPPVRHIEMADGTRLYQNMHENPNTPEGAKILQEFPLGRFDMSKIGTGEGAQAYGHGLYFAENEGVAQGYKDALRRKGDKITFDGKPLEHPRDFTEIQNKLENGEGDWRLYKAVEEITSRQGDMTARLDDIRNWYRNQPEMLAAIDRAEQRMSLNANPGSMYEVNIDADPNAFLDWDKPLSEQPEAVQGFANSLKDKSFLARKRLEDASAATGKDVWEKARNAFGVGQADAATKALAEAGIPGIKYLDAGSRSAGDGTRNYVVFDDSKIQIVRKFGIAGASALLGYNILDGLTPAQADELKKLEGK